MAITEFSYLQHRSRGNESALECLFPGRWTITKSNSCKRSNHLHVRDPWSVRTVKEEPSRKDRK